MKAPRSKNKYSAIKTEYNGDLYDSKKEAAHARKLDIWKKATTKKDKVIDIKRQVPMEVKVDGIKICKYLCDFVVTFGDGRVEHQDVKGVRTPVYKLKKKLVEAIYKIKIVEL